MKMIRVAASALALLICFVLGAAYGDVLSLWAGPSTGDRPQYQDGTTLILPAGYRGWPFLGASLGLTYAPEGRGPQPPLFTNTFVNPSSYRSFMETGRWPDGTIFMLEFRRSASEQGKGGQFATELVAVEAEVKDSRFADGWAFFDFGEAKALKTTSPALTADRAANCVACHTKNTAVERTFVQFYPALMEVARQKGTVKPGF